MKKPTFLCAVLLTTSLFSFAQPKEDTTTRANNLDEVVVTATRTPQKLGNVAVPVTIIKEKTIQQSGTLRLNNILAEQTGLFITNSFGAGVQMQGLSPDYTLILLNGQPMVGRNGGVLDLSRITVNNIKRIEIVKGPSSSLYGSEAMGGVINIITDNTSGSYLDASVRLGRFLTSDANLSGQYAHKSFSVSGFVNRNSTEGYDFNKKDTGKTVSPYQSYTAQVQLQHKLNKMIRYGIISRYYYERGNDLYSDGKEIVKGKPTLNEYNINPYINFTFTDKISATARGYFSQYQSNTKDYLQSNDSLYYDDFFQQRFQRAEAQGDWKISSQNTFNIGGGYIWERLNTNRYSGIRTNTISYAYVQDQQSFLRNHIILIGGLRYDANAAYANRLSPKLAARFKATDKLSFNASYGAGFKAPDYRQLYLNFTNNAAGGYTVYGANEVSAALLQQQLQLGILSSISSFGNELQQLKPEYSKGINVGADYAASRQLLLKLNFFRNDVDNLILTKIIATKTTGAPVYSYFNISSAFMQGAEADVAYQITKSLKAEAGYQLLQTGDKDVIDELKAGQVFGRKQGSLESVKLSRSDYGGLTGRSKHMANLKLFYEHKNWFATLRGVYRSRWGVGDNDGNLILNRDDEYASGYAQANVSGGINFQSGLSLMAGVDNVLNYQDKTYLTEVPGANYYLTIRYSFIKNNKHKTQL